MRERIEEFNAESDRIQSAENYFHSDPSDDAIPPPYLV